LLPVELFGALRGRLFDSNKNIVTATLVTVGNVASAMGQAAEKASKVRGFCYVFLIMPSWCLLFELNLNGMLQGILSDILKCLGDKNKHTRECALNTLDSWVAAVHLDKMVCPYPV